MARHLNSLEKVNYDLSYKILKLILCGCVKYLSALLELFVLNKKVNTIIYHYLMYIVYKVVYIDIVT